MFLKRTSPNLSIPFDGSEIEFGDSIQSKASIAKAEAQKQHFFGNRCGHDPLNPKDYLRPIEHRSRPSLIEKCIKRLKEQYFLPKNSAYSRSKDRQKRSERREAMMLVGQVFFHYLDLNTLKVGYISEYGTFKKLDIQTIAELSGIEYMRAKRAIYDLEKAKCIAVKRKYKKPSIREITHHFFKYLGIRSSRLELARDWKRKKLRNEQAKKPRDYVLDYEKEQNSFAPQNENNQSFWKNLKDLILKKIPNTS